MLQGYSARDTIAIKLFYKHAIEMDLMPFGAIENDEREITLHKPRLFRMDMPGFLELLPSAELIKLGSEDIRTCSIEGLILLKLYAWADHSERNKDLLDIDLLLARYIDIADNVYEEYVAVLDLYDETKMKYLVSVAGRIVGRKIAALLSHDKTKISRVREIILRRPVAGWEEMADGLNDV